MFKASDPLSIERRKRLAAEQLLQQRQSELSHANHLLDQHAQRLRTKVHESRAEALDARSDVKRISSSLTAARAETEIAEQRLWQSIDILADGFALFDAGDRLVIANEPVKQAFGDIEIEAGMPYETMLVLAVEEGLIDVGDTAPDDWLAMMREHWRSESSKPVTIKLWSGQYVRLMINMGARGDKVLLAIDITRITLTQQALRRAKQAAQAANRAKSSFLANMSHEIRTPINGIVGMAELIENTPLTDEQRLFAQTIHNSGEALLQIINDVLDYSRLDAEKLVMHETPLDLGECIADVIVMLRPAAQRNDVEITAQTEGLPARVMADAGRVRQILVNIIGNAVKFTKHGRVTVDGHVDEDKRVVLAISDTGIGMTGDDIASVFSEFTQVESSQNRHFEGTGLGLAIVQRLVSLMGGSITVDSRLGEGSTFTLTLPLPATEAPRETDEEQSVSTPYHPRSGRLRVLAAEDNATNRLVFSSMVNGLDLDLEFATNGKEALEKVEAFRPHLVFMDISMPGMDGKEATRIIRAMDDHKISELPIIALTALAIDGDEESILAAGLTEYMSKPLRRRSIFAAISRHCPAGVLDPVAAFDQDEGRTNAGSPSLERSAS